MKWRGDTKKHDVAAVTDEKKAIVIDDDVNILKERLCPLELE